MDNNALVAALGSDAVAAVHGYRLEVVDEARSRGLTLRAFSTGAGSDPIDVRLVFADGPAGVLTGQVLTWGPARGWSIARSVADAPRYLAGPLARPVDLVPTPAEVLDRVVTGRRGSTVPPLDVELDDEPAAIRRLIGFATVRRGRTHVDTLSLSA